MKKGFKIGLIVSSLALVIACSCIGVSIYKRLNRKTTHGPFLDKTYYSKEEYLTEYKEKVYPIYGGYPAILNEECAIKEYGVVYECHFELSKPHCTNPYQTQTLYVYDSNLGFDTKAENNLSYSFKVELDCAWFEDYPFDTPKEYEVEQKQNYNNENYYDLLCEFYIDYDERSVLIWHRIDFYTSLELTEEYCTEFAKKYLTRLDY